MQDILVGVVVRLVVVLVKGFGITVCIVIMIVVLLAILMVFNILRLANIRARLVAMAIVGEGASMGGIVVLGFWLNQVLMEHLVLNNMSDSIGARVASGGGGGGRASCSGLATVQTMSIAR